MHSVPQDELTGAGPGFHFSGQFSYSDVFRGHAYPISEDRHVSSIRYVRLFTPSLQWVPWPPQPPWPCGSPPSSVLWVHTIPLSPSSAVSGCPRPQTTSSAGDCEAFPSSWRIPLESVPRARDSGGSRQPCVTVISMQPSTKTTVSASATT